MFGRIQQWGHLLLGFSVLHALSKLKSNVNYQSFFLDNTKILKCFSSIYYFYDFLWFLILFMNILLFMINVLLYIIIFLSDQYLFLCHHRFTGFISVHSLLHLQPTMTFMFSSRRRISFFIIFFLVKCLLRIFFFLSFWTKNIYISLYLLKCIFTSMIFYFGSHFLSALGLCHSTVFGFHCLYRSYFS